MKISSVILVTLAACGAAAKSAPAGSPAPAAGGLDVTAVREDLRLYTDDKGHALALVEPDPEKPAPRELTLFWGADGTTFHQVPVASAHADGLKFEIGFDDARIPARPAGTVKREEGKTVLECYGTTVPLTLVPAERAKDALARARFVANRTRWSPVALGKQGDHYLYVDSGAATDNRDQYRVFTGTKGAMRAIPVVESRWDERENVLTLKTKEGTLLVGQDRNQQEYTLKPAWENRKEDWSSVERAASWRLIFEQLGLYPEGRSPTPCDLALR
jgi:hypothetical protein